MAESGNHSARARPVHRRTPPKSESASFRRGVAVSSCLKIGYDSSPPFFGEIGFVWHGQAIDSGDRDRWVLRRSDGRRGCAPCGPWFVTACLPLRSCCICSLTIIQEACCVSIKKPALSLTATPFGAASGAPRAPCPIRLHGNWPSWRTPSSRIPMGGRNLPCAGGAREYPRAVSDTPYSPGGITARAGASGPTPQFIFAMAYR